MKKKIKKAGEGWLVESLLTLARCLPRRAGQRFFSDLGRLAGRIFVGDRRRAVDNLALAFPEAPRMVHEAMAAAMFSSLGRNIYEFLRLEGSSEHELSERVVAVHGSEHLEKAKAEGRGIIALTGHIGCWELMPAYFIGHGYRVTAVARRMHINRLNERLTAIRASVGVDTLDRDSNPRAMLKVLRRGDALGVLIDQHTAVAGIYVPFFSRPAYTPTAVAKIALMTGAPILPMAIYMNRRGRHEVHVLPALPVPAATDRAAAVRSLTEQCSLAVERLIRIDPKQWVWFHDRWRGQAGDAIAARV